MLDLVEPIGTGWRISGRRGQAHLDGQHARHVAGRTEPLQAVLYRVRVCKFLKKAFRFKGCRNGCLCA
jgi:hypothetical protein